MSKGTRLTQKIQRLADYRNQKVRKVAVELTRNAHNIPEKIQRIFKFVRDEIKFGFPFVRRLIYPREFIFRSLSEKFNTAYSLSFYMFFCQKSYRILGLRLKWRINGYVLMGILTI